MSLLNEGMGDPTDSTHLYEMQRAATRFDLRSRQLNTVLYRIAIAAGMTDQGGRVDAAPEDIVALVERRLKASTVRRECRDHEPGKHDGPADPDGCGHCSDCHATNGCSTHWIGCPGC